MNDLKLAITSSSDENSLLVKNYLKKKYKIEELDLHFNSRLKLNFHAIIIVGGDGSMLHSIHNFKHLSCPFYGINAGTYGFLMNEFSINKNSKIESFEDNLISKIKSAESVNLKLLSMKCTDIDGNIYETIAFNEVYIYRGSNQAIKIKLDIDNEEQISELVGDGIIISTPAGSSAYNFSAGGRIVPLDSKVLCVTPICPFRPKRWHGAIIPDDSSVFIKINNYEKRPANAVADFKEIKNIVNVEISKNKTESVTLLFDKDSALKDRVIKEQFLL